MSDSYNDVKRIIQEMYDEFLKEEKRLTEICNSHSVRIDELEHKIHSLRKSEDVDFKVFSPRNSTNVNSDKIVDLEKEKDSLEAETRNYSKQLRYYSDKVNKLNEVLVLLGECNIKSSINKEVFSELPDRVEPDVVLDPFDELFPSRSDIKKETVDIPDNSVDDEETSITFNQIDISTSENEVLDSSNDNKLNIESEYIKNEVDQIIHKVEFTEKIVTNDTIRAKLELKEIVRLLKDLFK